jgi:hypothetical protein
MKKRVARGTEPWSDRCDGAGGDRRAPLRGRFSASMMPLALVPLLSVVVAGCKDGGCKSDYDCKGARVCESGVCVDAKAAAQPPATVPPAEPHATTTRASPEPTQPARPPDACLACSTQKEFDDATRKGRKCCPVTACRSDAECPSGQVCCRIPNGLLCADTTRCATADRVQPRTTRSGSFPCSGTRCAVGQRCCPGAREPCVRQELGCGDGSETTVGFECDQKTNEPCAPGEICRLGKVWRSPLTMTSVCEKP